ncbi:MAG: VWA domain-containing protein [Planctomycetes bacterium]|nr:VWA domain-containing protein [Planctomycetota bacterium]
MAKKHMVTVCIVFLWAAIFGQLSSVHADEKTDQLVTAYLTNSNWVIKVFAMMELRNQKSYDIYEAALLDSIKSTNENLRIYAVASVLKLDSAGVDKIKSAQVVEALITFLDDRKQPFLSDKASEALELLTGAKKLGGKKKKWEDWFTKNKASLPDHATVYKMVAKGQAAEDPANGGVESGGIRGGTTVARLEKLNKNGLDLVLCVDITGSMGPCVAAVQEQVSFLVNIIISISPSSKIGFVCYNDASWVALPFNSDLKVIQEAVNKQLGATGGGDWEEGVDKAYETALFDPLLEWREETWKLIVIMGDAPPHTGDVDRTVKNAEDAYKGTLVPPPPPPQDRKNPKKKVATGEKEKKPVQLKEVITSTIQTFSQNERAVVQGVFSRIATAGGGTYVNLDDPSLVINQILQMIFGKEWESVTSEFIEVFKANVAAADPKKKK